ncbi:MAG: alpha/beta hydrolase [Sedimenticola sp.]
MAGVYRNFTPEQLQAQYSARAAVPEHPQIFDRWQESSARYRAQARCTLDLAYGSSPREKLDLFLPERDNAPILLFIHGGYWQAMDKGFFSFLASPLVDHGVAVAIMNYDLCPDVTLDTIARQARGAVAWLWAEGKGHGLDRDRLHVAGHSAGGQLTAMMMATRWNELPGDIPADVITSGLSISGLFELEPLIHTAINEPLGLDLESARRNSPLLMEPATHAPLVLAVGGSESEEFHRQSRALSQAWGARGVPTSMLEVPGLNHFTMVEQLAEPGSLLLDRAMMLLTRQPN